MANQITKNWVEKVLRGLVPDGRYPDGQNLYCLVRGNAASWIFLRTHRGKQTVYSIGSVAKLADTANSLEVGKRATASLQQARLKAAEFRANIANGKPAKTIIKTGYPTLDDIVKYWCEFKKVDIKSTNSFVAPFEKIYKEYGPTYTKDMGVAFRDSLVKAGKADNTISTYIRQVKGMFSVYISDHSAEFTNPLDGVIFHKKADALGNRDPLSHDIIKKVYDALEGDYKKLWLTLTVTGARLNEIYGIKSKDISDGFLTIEKNDRRTIKNAASKRTIPLFIKLPKRSREYYWDDMASVSALSQAFQRQINKHIPKELRGKRQMTCHSLRHSLTDYLRYNDVQQRIEDKYLGHSAKDTSNRVYGSAEGIKQAMRQQLQPPVIAQYLKDIGIDEGAI